ncbi:MAG: ATP-binding cassette domain-containing protein [Deltaproteobacteria bacterium]|nr:ATP-binding cassette domain-containing protein [Deltaproteobacteria bacterium]
MIQIDGLRKSYGAFEALKGLTFDVPRGQVVGFLGPNGAGKSTTMKILAGYLAPSAGVARVGGVDVTADPVATRRMIGYLPENNPLYEDMMVREFLEFAADVRGIPTGERGQKIRHAVERCGVGPVWGKDIGQLSKGFRQRVGFAQAILHNPDLLILDEPTSGLDPNQIVEIRHLIKELGQEKTVIMSTHILPEVQATCSRVLIIAAGQVVADDSPERLTEGEGGIVTVVVAPKNGTPLDAGRIRGLFSALPGVQEVKNSDAEGEGTLGFEVRHGKQDPRRGLFEAAVQNGMILLELRRRQVSLEETFRRLTTAK